jgi:hypothetical protein
MASLTGPFSAQYSPYQMPAGVAAKAADWVHSPDISEAPKPNPADRNRSRRDGILTW